MAASRSELAVRALRKVKVVSLYETADPEQLSVAEEAITEAHGVLQAQGLLRWTLSDIPQAVEVSYVSMAAYLMADDFGRARDPAWMAQGMTQVQTFVHLPLEESAPACERSDYERDF